MATYFIGDIHGCYDTFQRLLDKINYDSSHDRLLFTGDLVGRGKDPLKTVNCVRQIQRDNPATQIVLGNHDLHLIAIFCGGYELSKAPDPTLMQVLQSPDAREIIDWFIGLPLIHQVQPESEAEAAHTETHPKDIVLVHAGIPHTWPIQQAQEHADFASEKLRTRYISSFGDSQNSTSTPDFPPEFRGTDIGELTHQLYGDHPRSLDGAQTETEKIRVIINYLTRMRMCAADGSADFAYNGTPADGPEGYQPWFAHQRQDKQLIVFGHWAALGGKTDREDFWAMDHACAWGKQLAAKRLEDRQLFVVDSVG